MAENKNYMPLCTLMPSELQLPSLQYCTRLLPSRTLRLRVHVCGCLYSQFYTFPVFSIVSATEKVLVGNSFNANCPNSQRNHCFFNTEGPLLRTSSQIKYERMYRYCNQWIQCVMQRFQWSLSFLGMLPDSVFTKVALWIGSVVCKCNFHACFVHVDCCFVIFIHWCISSTSIHELFKRLIMVRQLHLTWLILPV